VRILALTRYDQLGASSRLRTLQYLPKLRASGLTIDLSPLFDDRYVRDMYAKRISARHVAARYARRLYCMFSAKRYDLVWAEKELLPWVPSAIELGLIPNSVRLVVDYDDALFHRYDQHRSHAVRRVLGTKIDAVMRRADLVLAGNDYLAAHARAAGCKWVEWLPTVVDLDRYGVGSQAHTKPRGSVTVGWIGTPSTAGYLGAVVAPLAELAASGKVHCVAIGAMPEQVAGTPFVAKAWQEGEEVKMLRDLDIGIMPLPDAPWEKGKCGYKLIQYMACGLPVVASPVGVNGTIVEHGRNGFHASSGGDWLDRISLLVDDPQLRASMGKQGRRDVERSYSLQVQAPRLHGLLQKAASIREGH
jgi:glycosyltransferase involved in cell wall biosynthesis